MYVGRPCVNEVACCSYTRMKCGLITWAHCTRGAAVKAPEDGVHRSD
jgi:hypothetical protein